MARKKFKEPVELELLGPAKEDKWDGSPMGGFVRLPPDWCDRRITAAHGCTWMCSIICGHCGDQFECPAFQKFKKEREV